MEVNVKRALSFRLPQSRFIKQKQFHLLRLKDDEYRKDDPETFYFTNFLIDDLFNLMLFEYDRNCKIIYADCELASKLIKVIDNNILLQFYKNALIFTKNVTKKYDLILFPCLRNTHFFLIALDTRKHTFTVHDTLPEYFEYTEKQMMLKNLKNNFLHTLYMLHSDTAIDAVSEYTCIVAECEPQVNSFDCGPAICLIAESLIKGLHEKEPGNQIDNTYDTIGPYHFYRRNLQLLVLNASKSVQDLCLLCEKIGDITNKNNYKHNWIGCDMCARWFHTNCIIEAYPTTKYRDLITNPKYTCKLCQLFKQK